MAGISPPYRRIYFDSNILIRAKWPRLSQTMRTALNTASNLSIPVVLLQSVERELKAHCLREFTRNRREIIGKAEALNNLYTSFGFDVSVSMPSDAKLAKAYDKAVEENALEFQLLRNKPKLRQTKELFEMAIHQKKPFGDKGKNFQDAVICLAAIDDLASSSEKVGAFVSRDDIFDQELLDDLCKSRNVTMRFFNNEVALNDDLRTFLRQQWAREWDDDEKLAMDAVAQNLLVLQKFIEANLEMPARLGLFGSRRILRLNRIEIAEIKRVETPAPWNRTPEEPVTITAQILVHVHATVRKPTDSSRTEEVLKVGTAPRSLSERIAAPLYTEKEEVLERTVNLELRAQLRDGRYVSLEPLSVAFGTPRSTALPPTGFGSIGTVR